MQIQLLLRILTQKMRMNFLEAIIGNIEYLFLCLCKENMHAE